MDNEKLEQRITWLDDERRKDKAALADLEDRLLKLEGKLDSLQKKDQELDSDLTRLRASAGRVDDFEADLNSFRVTQKKDQKAQEKVFRGWITDTKKDLRTQIQGLETEQKKLREELKRIRDLEISMDARLEEETRFNASLREIEKSFADIKKDYQDYQREAKVVQSERQKDVKRVADLQSENAALRKRVDEIRGMLDLVSADYQKIKTRIQELENVRRELKLEQDNFLEQAGLQRTELETTWKSWQSRFDSIEKQAQDLDEQMTKLDSTHRNVKRMQDKLQDLSDLLDRRVNEITEMQRLTNEKFRMEWNTFTADDQKRWTNHTLAQKEQVKMLERQHKESTDRISVLEDGLQEIEDQLMQVSKFSETQLQGLLELMREWTAEFEGVMDGLK